MHRDTFIPVAATIVGPTNGIRVGMRQRPFDRIGRPLAAFVKQGGGRSSQTMSGDFAHRITHPPETLVDRILAQWAAPRRSEEHTSELQSLMRISYAVFCLKKKY